MKLGKAVQNCKVRGYVYRKSNPGIKYAKNHNKTILERVLDDLGNEGLYYDDWDYNDPEQDHITG